MKTHKKKRFCSFLPYCARVCRWSFNPLWNERSMHTHLCIYIMLLYLKIILLTERAPVLLSRTYINVCSFLLALLCLLAFLMISHTERREVPIEIDNKCERSFFVLSIKKNIFFNEEQQCNEKGKIYSAVSLSLWSSTSSTIHKMPENVFLNVFIKITYTKVCIVQYAVAASSSFLRKDHRWM